MPNELPPNVTVDRRDIDGKADYAVRLATHGEPLVYRVRMVESGGGYVVSDPAGGTIVPVRTFDRACRVACNLAVILSRRVADAEALDC